MNALLGLVLPLIAVPLSSPLFMQAVPDPLSDTQTNVVIEGAKQRFWGNAVDSQDNTYELQDGDDPAELLIPLEEARRIVEEATVYGFALWCDLDWNQTYLDYMRYERYAERDERQIAFIGLLFGMTQGYIKNHQDSECDERDSAAVTKVFDAEVQRIEGLFQRADHAVCYAYLYGKGRPQDFDKAVKWCRKAAESGMPQSQTLLAEIYLNGYGVDKDYSASADLYRQAADQGFVHAQYMLGAMYLDGAGVPADKAEALQWLKKAASQNYQLAKELLSELERPHN